MASKIKVMLLAKVPRIGSPKEVIEVKKGFAMNYLIPQGFAKVATKQDIKYGEERAQILAEKAAALKDKASEIKDLIMKDPTLALDVKVTDKGTLYGSVSAEDLSDALSKKVKMEVPASAIKLSKAIKETGEHQVSITLADGVACDITVNVQPTE